MILKLKIKSNNKTKSKQIFVWIEKNKAFKEDVQKRIGRHVYYKITSDNPAIMLSLLTTVQELIPEIYFNSNQSVDVEEYTQI